MTEPRVPVTVRMPTHLAKVLHDKAAGAGKSLNALAVEWLEKVAADAPPAPAKMTEVEHVARALCRSEKLDPDDILDGSPIWDHWEDAAKAAIAAINEWRKANT